MFHDIKKEYALKKFQFIIRNKEYEKYTSLQNIHPIKQKELFLILENQNITKSIDNMTVFGSAKTPLCRVKSDIDICIKLKEDQCSDENKLMIKNVIGKITDWKSDLVYKDELSEKSQLNNYINKGVVIYE